MFRMPVRRGKRGGIAAAVAALCVASGLSLNAAGAETSANYSLFNNADTSVAVVDSDNKEVELGLRFSSSKSGSLSAVRFLKATGDSASSHVVSVWDAKGRRLASATSKNETASGWQQVQLSSPIAIRAASIYVVSFHTTRYVATNDFFTSGRTVGPLTALRNGGVFAYGPTSFPRDTWRASNYWLDVVFSASGVVTNSTTSTTAPQVTTTTAPPATTSTTAPPASTTSTTVPQVTTTTAPPATTSTTAPPAGSYVAPPPGVPGRWTPSADWNVDPNPGYGQHPCPAFPAFPDDNCTGYQHTNVSLVPCSGDIEQSNIHLDRCEFQGNLKIIGASNVLITRSKVKGTVNAHWSTDYDFRRLTLMDVEVIAVPESAIATKNFLFNDGGSATNGSDLKCIRCRIHYVPTGISLGDNSIIKDSYISDVTWGPEAHQAGIGAGQWSGDNSKIIHNNIQCNRWNTNTPGFYHGCSSALSLYPENRLDNVWVEKNLMNTTGRYCTYAGGGDKDGSEGGPPQWGSNITFIDNRFGTKLSPNCGTDGPVTAFNSDISSNVWRGNAWADGREIPMPIWRD